MAIEDIPIADRKRMALCYINSTNKQAVDWATAATEYDPKVKEASFKTVTLRNLKAIGNGDVPENDLNRFALCFAYCSDKQAIDWAVAASKYDPKVKVASFKTVTLRAMKKHGFGATVTSAAKASPQKKGAAKSTAKKRKAADDDEDTKSSRRKVEADEDDTIKTNDVNDDEDEDARIQREIAENDYTF